MDGKVMCVASTSVHDSSAELRRVGSWPDEMAVRRRESGSDDMARYVSLAGVRDGDADTRYTYMCLGGLRGSCGCHVSRAQPRVGW